jgi:biopolymer transport protein ExbD
VKIVRRPAAGETIPNLAPMVDVIMVLLIFFLMGASFDLLTEGMLQTELDPRTGPGAGAAIEITPRIRIALSDVDNGRNAAIRVFDAPLPPGDFQALYDYLNTRRGAGADADNPVVIGADAAVRWNFVVQAMDAAVRAGFKNVQFAVSMNENAG